MTESPLQKALKRLKDIELEYRESHHSSGLAPLIMVELILQEMEAEMTAEELRFDKNVIEVKHY